MQLIPNKLLGLLGGAYGIALHQLKYDLPAVATLGQLLEHLWPFDMSGIDADPQMCVTSHPIGHFFYFTKRDRITS